MRCILTTCNELPLHYRHEALAIMLCSLSVHFANTTKEVEPIIIKGILEVEQVNTSIKVWLTVR